MRVRFKYKKLEKLYKDEKGAKDYPEEIIVSLMKKLSRIEAASNELDLRSLKSLHYEKLKEKKWKGCYSIRLNIQYRLIFEWRSDEEGRYLNIIKIDKHDYK